MKRMEFDGYVEESGTLRFKDPKPVRDFLHALAGEDVIVRIGKHYKNRTERENRYYWGVIIPIIAEEIGEEDKDIVHAWIQGEVGNTKSIRGKEIPSGTKKKSTAEFEDYCARIRMFASKFLHTYIPEPNEGIRDIR